MKTLLSSQTIKAITDAFKALGGLKSIQEQHDLPLSFARKQAPAMIDYTLDVMSAASTKEEALEVIAKKYDLDGLEAHAIFYKVRSSIKSLVDSDFTLEPELESIHNKFKIVRIDLNELYKEDQLTEELNSRRRWKKHTSTLIEENLSNSEKTTEENISYILSFEEDENTEAYALRLYNEVFKITAIDNTFNYANIREKLATVIKCLIPSKSGKLILGAAALRIGLKLCPTTIDGLEVVNQTKIEFGHIIIDKLARAGIIDIESSLAGRVPGTQVRTKQFNVSVNWEQKFSPEIAKAIETLNQTFRPLPMLCKPIRYTAKKKGGFLTEECRTPLSKSFLRLSKTTITAINHRNSVGLELFTFNGDLKKFNEYISAYIKIREMQILEAQEKLNNAYIKASEEDRGELIRVTRFDTEKFKAEVNKLVYVKDGKVYAKTYYIIAQADDRTRLYDVQDFGFQADKFLRHLIRFSRSEKMTITGRKQTKRYMKHVKEEIADLRLKSDIKSQKELLGMKAKLAQLEYDLENNVSDTPIEQDVNNSGVQVYGTILGSRQVGQYAGLDPQGKKDAYLELVNRLQDKLGIEKEMRVLFRNDGKKPVMVFIYGAGKKTIITDGGEGWKGIRTALLEAGVPNVPSENEMYKIFQEVMEDMLPGVQKLMKEILSKHGSKIPGATLTNDKMPIVFRWTSLAGNSCQLKLESLIEENYKMAFVGSRTNKGHLHSYSLKTMMADPRAKTQALAPLLIHSTDASLLIFVLELFSKKGYDIGTVHDAFFTRANQINILNKAYKLALIRLKRSNIMPNMLTDCTANVSQDMRESYVSMHKSTIETFSVGHEPLTDRDIALSEPVGF